MIKINQAIPKDAIKIYDVFYQTWLATYPNDEVGVTVQDIEEKYKNRLSPELIKKRQMEIAAPVEGLLLLTAKEGEEVVGVCRLKKKDDYNELMAIYVLPSHQRKGIGNMFWEKALDFFSDEKDIIVHVASYNIQAINFYKKLGFRDTGKRFSDEKHKMPISGVVIPEMEMICNKSKLKTCPH